MKKTITHLAIILFCIMIFACKKEENILSSGNSKQQISLRVNGTLFSVTSRAEGVVESDAHISDGNKFQLDAETSDGKSFHIDKNNITGNGTYNVGTSVFSFAQWDNGTTVFSSLATTKSRLSFTITNRKRANDYLEYTEGTFSGVLYNITNTDSVRITEGEFKFID
jgi:hypothetical protein